MSLERLREDRVVSTPGLAHGKPQVPGFASRHSPARGGERPFLIFSHSRSPKFTALSPPAPLRRGGTFSFQSPRGAAFPCSSSSSDPCPLRLQKRKTDVGGEILSCPQGRVVNYIPTQSPRTLYKWLQGAMWYMERREAQTYQKFPFASALIQILKKFPNFSDSPISYL